MSKRVLAISGSTRAHSVNRLFINAVKELGASHFSIDLFDGLADIPHFNPDLDTEQPPAAVEAFREKVKLADGILICSPEYAMGVPGALKNALDWTVSTSDFSGKPVALITASLSGQKAHESLLGTLRVIEAKIEDDSQVVISFAKTKINQESRITDEPTLEAVKRLIRSFDQQLQETTGS